MAIKVINDLNQHMDTIELTDCNYQCSQASLKEKTETGIFFFNSSKNFPSPNSLLARSDQP